MQKLRKPLMQKNNAGIVLVVLDGLGGLPVDGRTEIETARTPNLDALLPEMLSLNPDVLVITGDHSTPSVMNAGRLKKSGA